jgi:carboxypeptidase C (cathepsin A)
MRIGGLGLGLAVAAAMLAGQPARAQFPGRGAPTWGYEPAKTDPPPVKTEHSITVHGKTLRYTAEVGKIPIPDASGKTMGHMFYVAYILNHPPPNRPRPVTFSYNGGPGSDSVYVHMGGFGPRRVALEANGDNPAPPYRIVDNQDTWLDATDLVFVDAIGTGYSRATSRANLMKAATAQGDLDTFTQFVRLWLYQNNRIESPVILAGESYGTFRTGGLAFDLWQHHIALSGIVLLSAALNQNTITESYSDDRPYWLALPTQTAVAWHFHKLPAALEKEPLPAVVQQAEHWAQTKYQQYLDLGGSLQGAERQEALKEMAEYTGLSPRLLDEWNLRISTAVFDASLLRGQREIIGRYDGTQTAASQTPGDVRPDFDASDLLATPYIDEFVDYLRDELHYRTPLEYGDRGDGGAGIPMWTYNIGGTGGAGGWGARGGGNDVSQDLERTFAEDPTLRLMDCQGYFDQATPILEAQYGLWHLFVTPAALRRVQLVPFLSGHMIYAHQQSREQLHADFDGFVKTLAGMKP